MQPNPQRHPSFALLAALLASAYLALALFLWLGLDYRFMRSDVEWYWSDSLSWQAPFNSYHVSGYPLCIALVRTVTFDTLPPILVMMSVNLAALLLAAWALFRIGTVSGLTHRQALFGGALVALWPFVGLTFTVNPLADLPAISIFLAGLLSLLQGRTARAGLLLGISMVFHKALWPFVGLLTMARLVAVRSRKWSDLGALVLLAAPLFLLWLGGALYHHDPLWIVSHSADVGQELRSRSAMMAGFLAPVQQGLFKALVKGCTIWALLGLAMLVPLAAWRLKAKGLPYILAICTSSASLFVLLTQAEIWAAVRYSRLLAVPLTLLLGVWGSSGPGARLIRHPLAPATILTLLLASQFAYAWYMARLFFE